MSDPDHSPNQAQTCPQTLAVTPAFGPVTGFASIGTVFGTGQLQGLGQGEGLRGPSRASC
jgi:hypothetical protein